MQDLTAIGLIYIVTLVLFRGIIFDNAAFQSGGDTAAAISYAEAGNRIAQAEGVDVLWMPSFFSGMPTFGNVAYLSHDVSYIQKYLQPVLNFLYLNGKWTWLVVYCFLGGVFMFFLMRVWKFSRVAALLAAFTFMLSPYAIGLAGEGHGSKLMALSYLPLVVLLTHLMCKRRDILSFGLLAATIGTLMLTRHMQMVYYVFIVLGLYFLYDVVQGAKAAPRQAFLKVALFMGALAIGFCISSYIYLSVYEYAQYSMRGGGTTGATGGLTYDYATNWSWHPAELITLLIPGFYGMKAEYYWGSVVPWTNSSVYVGLLPILFGIIAIVFKRTRLVIFFSLTTLVVILVSLGGNFSLLYQFLFSYLPFFNKFRAPSMILHLLPFTMGVLAAVGFSALQEAKEKESGIDRAALARVLWIVGGTIAGLLILAVMFKSSLFDPAAGSTFLKDGETEQFQRQYAPQQVSRVIAQVRQLRFEIFWKDYVKFSLLAAALCGLVIAWLRDKVREWVFATAAVTIVIVDLSLVSSKYIDPKPSQSLEQNFRPDATISFLKQQPGLFRVFPLGQQLFMDNTFAYHGLQSIGGYSPAKLKIYQTMIDSCLYHGPDPSFPLNMSVVNMLNVRYLVAPGRLPEDRFPLVNTDQAKRVLTYTNPSALPRAFFVNNYTVAQNDREAFDSLNSRSFDPSQTAVLYKALPQAISRIDTPHAEVTEFKSRHITIKTTSTSTGLMVLSEVYYPAGWKAFVDGNETEIYRTNYVLRSVLVPPGAHEVTFSLDPPLYTLGWTLSNTAWIVVGICILIGLWGLPAVRRSFHKQQLAEASRAS